jgi:hypothetical protein
MRLRIVPPYRNRAGCYGGDTGAQWFVVQPYPEEN